MKKSMGEIISTLRKNKNMTQNELALKMNVTDKAVSKWERNISCPDINSLSKLAEVLDTSVEELLKSEIKQENNSHNKLLNLILIGVSLAMGICLIVTAILGKIKTNDAFLLIGIGITSLALYLLINKDTSN